MSVGASGTLALVRPAAQAATTREETARVEHWSTGGQIAYRVSGGEMHDTTLMEETWPHYRWTFRYRFQGRTLQIGYMRGTGLPGIPKGWEGLASAFSDAASVEWDSFEGWANDMGYDPDVNTANEWKNAQRIYNACERMGRRLERFIPDDDERAEWRKALEAMDR